QRVRAARVPDHAVHRAPPPSPPDQSDALVPTVCVALTLVVMFALMVTLQIYLVESTTIQDLLGFNMSFNPDTLFVSNATRSARTLHDTTVPSNPRWPRSGGVRPTKTRGTTPTTLPTTHPTTTSTPLPVSEANVSRVTVPDLADWFTLAEDPMYLRFRSPCVYRARARSRSRGGRSYGIGAFPFHLCTDAVYCCATIDPVDATVKPGNASFDVFKNGFRRFRALKTRNRHLRVWLALGGGDNSGNDRDMFRKIARDENLCVQFAANLVDWLETHGYDGVYLYWKYPEAHDTGYLVDLLRVVKDTFRRLTLSLGVVVPLDHQLRERFDMRELVDLLDDYSILVDPMEEPRAYGRTALKWTQDTIDRYAEVFRETQYTLKGHRRSGRFQLCYPLLLDGAAYTLFSQDNTTTNEGVDTSGPGQAGRSSKRPGRLAYDELCRRRRWDAAEERAYCRVALYGSQWISYPTPDTVEAFARGLMKVTGASRCLGVWDPSWDDFAGHCGKGAYPLVATLFNVERTPGKAGRKAFTKVWLT
ncbi:unnamed protein product, partial [Ixodes hexagonus]